MRSRNIVQSFKRLAIQTKGYKLNSWGYYMCRIDTDSSGTVSDHTTARCSSTVNCTEWNAALREHYRQRKQALQPDMPPM